MFLVYRLKGKVSALLFLIGLIVYSFQPAAGSFFIFISLIMYIPYWSRYLVEYVYGVPYKEPRVEAVEDQAVYIVPENGGYRFGTALKIVDVNYNVFDMDETSFLGLSKSVIDSMITDYDVDYRIIYVKRGNSIEYYVQVSIKGEDISMVRIRLLDVVRRVKQALENTNIRAVVAGKDDLIYPLTIKEQKPRYIIPSLLTLLGGLLFYRGFPHINLILTLGLLLIATGIYIFKNKRAGAKLVDSMVVASEDPTSYEPANPIQYYRNAQNLHNALNKSPYDYLLIVNITPVDTGKYMELNTKRYNLAKWATALGRFEWMDESERLKGLLDRLGGTREMLYRFMVIGFTKNSDTADILKSHLERMGLRVKKMVLKSNYIDIY